MFKIGDYVQIDGERGRPGAPYGGVRQVEDVDMDMVYLRRDGEGPLGNQLGGFLFKNVRHVYPVNQGDLSPVNQGDLSLVLALIEELRG